MARPPGRASGLRRLVAALLLLATAAVVAVVAVAVLSPTTLWTPEGRDLAESLDRAGDGFGVPDPCLRSRGGWLCTVENDPGSGVSGEYRLRVRGEDCWTARETGRFDAASNPRRLEACLKTLDYVVP